MSKIPKEFYNVNSPRYPVVVETVGEMIEQLKRLPPDLPVQQGFSERAVLTVFNVDADHRPPSLEVREDE